MASLFDKLTPEERRELGRKGGIASGESKRKKKARRETLELLLEMPLKKGKVADIENIKSFTDLKGKNIDVDTALMVTLVQKALKGDLTALRLINEILGNLETQTKEDKVVIVNDLEEIE